ncbi:MAG: cytochrome c biogenesis protein ResB [Verrucomicrobiota bacterium]
MINRLFKIFSSLRLTVTLLGLALLLVFIGTLAQVKLGLYAVQSDYFRSLFVFWQPKGASWKIPVFPGGWLLGGLLLTNLIAAHVKRFQFTKKKIGIFTIHAGLILLLLGQFFTELFQVESNIRFEEGDTRNYSEDSRRTELTFIDSSRPDRDEVIAVPEELFAKGGEIRSPKFPFVIRVKNYFPNSRVAGPMSGGGGKKINATTPSGEKLWFSEAPLVATMDARNVPSVLLEFVSNKNGATERIASLWIDQAQSVEIDGRTYQMGLRPTRYYLPYEVTLLEFRHDLYQGTPTPKNFSSKVHLSDPKPGEDRNVVIKMNDPLRHAGLTFFQSGFDERNDKITILQVVRNPAAITPYLACSLVGLGLLIQFLTHIVGFGRRQRNKTPVAPNKSARRKPMPVAEEKEPA